MLKVEGLGWIQLRAAAMMSLKSKGFLQTCNTELDAQDDNPADKYRPQTL